MNGVKAAFNPPSLAAGVFGRFLIGTAGEPGALERRELNGELGSVKSRSTKRLTGSGLPGDNFFRFIARAAFGDEAFGFVTALQVGFLGAGDASELCLRGSNWLGFSDTLTIRWLRRPYA